MLDAFSRAVSHADAKTAPSVSPNSPLCASYVANWQQGLDAVNAIASNASCIVSGRRFRGMILRKHRPDPGWVANCYPKPPAWLLPALTAKSVSSLHLPTPCSPGYASVLDDRCLNGLKGDLTSLWVCPSSPLACAVAIMKASSCAHNQRDQTPQACGGTRFQQDGNHPGGLSPPLSRQKSRQLLFDPPSSAHSAISSSFSD